MRKSMMVLLLVFVLTLESTGTVLAAPDETDTQTVEATPTPAPTDGTEGIAGDLGEAAAADSEFAGVDLVDVALTDEQIIRWVVSGEHNVIHNDWASHIDFARAIESAVLQAHGLQTQQAKSGE